MGLEKAIKSGKEHRKEYKYKKNYCKSVDKTCRNHGSCPWCKGNRTNKYKNMDKISKKELQVFDI